MKVETAIKARRSIRNYLSKKVTLNALTKILDAAIYTPMAGNVFSPRFVVVTDKKKKATIASCCLDQRFIQQAPVIIVVCSDPEQVKQLYGHEANRYVTQQVGAAIQNMLLQATELGLATCWVGAFEEGRLKRTLSIPGGVKAEGVIALGHSARKPKMPPKKDLNMVVFFETYGKPGGWKDVHHDHWEGVRETVFEK